MTDSPGLCPASVKAAMSGMYDRNMSSSGLKISLKPLREGKKVPQNTVDAVPN